MKKKILSFACAIAMVLTCSIWLSACSCSKQPKETGFTVMYDNEDITNTGKTLVVNYTDIINIEDKLVVNAVYDNSTTTQLSKGEGGYTVTSTIPTTLVSGETYTYVISYKEYNTVTITVSVNKRTPTITVTADLNKAYDGVAVELPTTGYSTDSNGAVTVEWYKVDDQSNMTLCESAPVNAGNYAVKVKTGESSNFSASETVYNFTISKAVPAVTAPTITTVYNTDNTLSDITLPNGFEWVDPTQKLQLGNNEYLVRYTPEDVNNYEVVDNISVFVRANLLLSVPQPQDITYDGQSHVAIFNGFDERYMEYVTSEAERTQTLVGAYPIVIKLKDGMSKNGIYWKDGSNTLKNTTWRITKRIVELPELINKIAELKGESVTTQWAEHSFDWCQLSEGYDVNYTVSDAGLYNIPVELKDINNTEWFDGSFSPKTITFKVVINPFDSIKINDEDYEYVDLLSSTRIKDGTKIKLQPKDGYNLTINSNEVNEYIVDAYKDYNVKIVLEDNDGNSVMYLSLDTYIIDYAIVNGKKYEDLTIMLSSFNIELEKDSDEMVIVLPQEDAHKTFKAIVHHRDDFSEREFPFVNGQFVINGLKEGSSISIRYYPNNNNMAKETEAFQVNYVFGFSYIDTITCMGYNNGDSQLSESEFDRLSFGDYFATNSNALIKELNVKLKDGYGNNQVECCYLEKDKNGVPFYRPFNSTSCTQLNKLNNIYILVKNSKGTIIEKRVLFYNIINVLGFFNDSTIYDENQIDYGCLYTSTSDINNIKFDSNDSSIRVNINDGQALDITSYGIYKVPAQIVSTKDGKEYIYNTHVIINYGLDIDNYIERDSRIEYSEPGSNYTNSIYIYSNRKVNSGYTISDFNILRYLSTIYSDNITTKDGYQFKNCSLDIINGIPCILLTFTDTKTSTDYTTQLYYCTIGVINDDVTIKSMKVGSVVTQPTSIEIKDNITFDNFGKTNYLLVEANNSRATYELRNSDDEILGADECDGRRPLYFASAGTYTLTIRSTSGKVTKVYTITTSGENYTLPMLKATIGSGEDTKTLTMDVDSSFELTGDCVAVDTSEETMLLVGWFGDEYKKYIFTRDGKEYININLQSSILDMVYLDEDLKQHITSNQFDIELSSDVFGKYMTFYTVIMDNEYSMLMPVRLYICDRVYLLNFIVDGQRYGIGFNGSDFNENDPGDIVIDEDTGEATLTIKSSTVPTSLSMMVFEIVTNSYAFSIIPDEETYNQALQSYTDLDVLLNEGKLYRVTDATTNMLNNVPISFDSNNRAVIYVFPEFATNINDAVKLTLILDNSNI
ncbi:MAG TPA: hypothetical protein DD621_02490 [Clostridiales bacterium]|nr:hypothetical protein [Clostridiales bacterium]